MNMLALPPEYIFKLQLENQAADSGSKPENLGNWISNTRVLRKRGVLTREQIDLLDHLERNGRSTRNLGRGSTRRPRPTGCLDALVD